MSIEQAIAENTAALNALASAVRALASNPNAAGAVAAVETAAAEPKAEQVKAKKQAGPAATQEQKEDPAVVVDDVTDAKDFEPVTYDQCAAAITSLAKGKGRAAAVEVLKSFGAEKLPDVKEDAEKLAAIYVAATAALEA